MTIEKAMICLSILVEVKHRLGKNLEAESLQLGIEALDFINAQRRDRRFNITDRLPGETEPEPQPTREEVKKYLDERKREG